MIQNIIIGQVKKLLIKSIVRFSKEEECNVDKLFISIYCNNEFGDPLLKLYKNGKILRDIDFSDLYTPFQKKMYSEGFGFDISVQMPLWVKKFLLKSSIDNEIEIIKPMYILSVMNNDLKAFMYVDNKQVKEIEISYILETK